jgi:hypothetical protein
MIISHLLLITVQVTTSAAESDRMLVRARAAATSHIEQVRPCCAVLTATPVNEIMSWLLCDRLRRIAPLYQHYGSRILVASLCIKR